MYKIYMYFHIFYDCTNYVCIVNRHVNDRIAHKIISVAHLFSLYGTHSGSNPIPDHNNSKEFNQ